MSDVPSTPPALVPPAETPEAAAAEPPASELPVEAPRDLAAEFDPNRNLVYDLLFDVADLEMIGRLKWDIFSVEDRLSRALLEDRELEASDPQLHQELTLALQLFRADEQVRAYKERFVRSEERLKLAELVRFLELAIVVREPLHAAWTKYLAHVHTRLLKELASVDREGLAKRPAALLSGARETESRRCKAVIVHTERSARQVFNEIPYRDYSRVIAWYEEKNPLLGNLVADARVLYLHTALTRQGSDIAKQLRMMAWVTAAFAAITAVAAIVGFLK